MLTKQANGGDELYYRLMRMAFDGQSLIRSMYKGNPILTLFLFGLPLSFLSIIIYTSCCSDILDVKEEENEEEEDQDEEEEGKHQFDY